VPAEELKVAVSKRGISKIPVTILSKTPVRIPAGGTARVRISVPGNMLAGRARLELSEPPEGITIEKVEPSRQGGEIVLRSDAMKIKPGLKGNLIVDVFPAGTPNPAQGKSVQANRPRIPLTTLPAISFEIVP